MNEWTTYFTTDADAVMANVTFYENPIPSMVAPGLPAGAATTDVPSIDRVQLALQILAARGVDGA